MTDTDDTDDLLLIPPDFFTIKSDSGQSNIDPYFDIVDSLIDQVDKLQNRIKVIESSESFITNSPDSSHTKERKMQKHKGFRKYGSSDDVYVPNSSQSTPQKPHTKFRMNSLPASPYVEKFNTSQNPTEFNSLSSSPNRNRQPYSPSTNKENNIINEVDTFLSNVKTIQRLNAVRNLENDFNSIQNRFPSDNPSAKESAFLPAKSDGTESRDQTDKIEPLVIKENTWQCGDNKNSVPHYNFGVREQSYQYSSKNRSLSNQNPSKYESGDQKYMSNISSVADGSLTSAERYPESDTSTSDSISQVTTFRKPPRTELLNDPIHINALNILNMHKQVTENSAKKNLKHLQREQSMFTNNSSVNENLGLVNLADIWNTSSSQLLQLNSSQLMQKLQEEKLRRQHCEELIQDLQNRNLELQQKMSVAVKVDACKNKTIEQFQETLTNLLNKMQDIQKEKKDWDTENHRLKTKYANEIKENNEKIQIYEKEVSKALNIAHASQEKMAQMEKNCSELQKENISLKNTQKDLEDLLDLERNKSKELSENLKVKDIELNQMKETLDVVKSEIGKTNVTIATYQENFSKLKEETSRLQEDLRESNERNLQYEEQKKHLLAEIQELKKSEMKLKDEIAAAKKYVDQNKVEIRNYYQGQVELLVQNKQKEFQAQLDKSENNCREEIRKREIAIAKTAAMHITQLSEKHKLEVDLLEKKHQQEVKLYHVQTMKYKQQNEELETKLHRFQEECAKQLQKVMEIQWAEVLRIITNGKCTNFVNNEDSFSTLEQLNSLKTRSYNNLEEILSKQVTNPLHNDQGAKGSSNEEDKNHMDDMKLSMDTPVSSKGRGSKTYNEQDVQKYVSLLLNRPYEGSSKENGSDQLQWPNEQVDHKYREKRNHKPPWK